METLEMTCSRTVLSHLHINPRYQDRFLLCINAKDTYEHWFSVSVVTEHYLGHSNFNLAVDASGFVYLHVSPADVVTLDGRCFKWFEELVLFRRVIRHTVIDNDLLELGQVINRSRF